MMTTTYTSSSAYFAATGTQTFENFDTPLSVTTSSAIYSDISYSSDANGNLLTFNPNNSGDLYLYFSSAVPAVITFDHPVTSFGISLYGLGTVIGEPSTLQLSTSSGFSADVITNYSSNDSNNSVFVGLVSDVPFTSVTISDLLPPQGGIYVIDGVLLNNLYYGLAPSTLTETAAQLQTLTPSQISALPTQAITSIVSTGPGDTEFTAAQVSALETSGLAVSGPHGTQVELADSIQGIISLLGSQTLAGLANNLVNLEKTGVTNIDVMLFHHALEIPQSVDSLLKEVNQLTTQYHNEPAQAQAVLVGHVLDHLYV